MLHCISLKRDCLTLQGSTRLIKADEFVTLNNSVELLEYSNDLAKKRIEDASESISELREAARFEGLTMGEMQSTEQILTVTKNIEQYLQGVELELAGLVFDAVKKIVLDFDDITLVSHSIEQGLKQMRGRKQVSVRVSHQLLEEVEACIEAMDTEASMVNVIPCKNLQGSDCILESNVGIVNSSVSTQLMALAKALHITTKS